MIDYLIVFPASSTTYPNLPPFPSLSPLSKKMDKFMLDEVESPSAPYDVIVVGGGVSGLRAAGHLQSKYGLKVLLLEAREKLGG